MLLSIIMQPFSPRVAITNLMEGHVARMDTSALGTKGTVVHAWYIKLKLKFKA